MSTDGHWQWINYASKGYDISTTQESIQRLLYPP